MLLVICLPHPLRLGRIHIHFLIKDRIITSNTRIQRLRHQHDFIEATKEATGLQILTNVSFDTNAPEAVRLNLASPNSSLRRSALRMHFPRSTPPFTIHNPAVLLSSDQIAGLQDNFASVHEAIGDTRLGSISIESPTHESMLPMIQARSYEIVWIDTILETLSLDSALYRSYLRHPKSVNFFENGKLTDQGVTLLNEFIEASNLYTQLPELRDYFDQGSVRVDEIGPRGQQFREWLQGNSTIKDGSDIALDYVAYELRPLRISGGCFQWKQSASIESTSAEGVSYDLRRISVDLLLRFEGYPLWTELKMQGDTWASCAFQQILFYGSMLNCGNQQRRCRRYFAEQFQCFQPWLGVLVEDRADPKFLADYEQTLKAASSELSKSVLGNLFGGLVFGMIQKTESGWKLSRSDVVRWL